MYRGRAHRGYEGVPRGVQGVHIPRVYREAYTQGGIPTRVYTTREGYLPGYTHPGRLTLRIYTPREANTLYTPPERLTPCIHHLRGYNPGIHHPGYITVVYIPHPRVYNSGVHTSP